MKKLLCLVLTVMMLVTCFIGCGDNDTASNVSSDVVSSDAQGSFQKPENYASVVLVSINPRFRLYLDVNGIVLAVESVNEDARSIEAKITFDNQKVETVVGNLITAANDGGFVKADAKIDIKVTEIVNNTVVATEILDNIKTTANKRLTELDITAEITVAVDIKNDEPTQSEENISDTTSNTASVPDENTACEHKITKTKPVSTGKNIIDDSKYDMVDHATVCSDCGEQLSLEKHTVSGEKCTACGQNNFTISNIYPTSAGVAGDNGIEAAEINDDGSISYNLIIESSWWEADGEAIDMWNFKIPEANMLKAIRTTFVMSDEEFKKLKQQGTYECSLGTQTYADGYFYCVDPAAGGPGSYSHEIVGYKDNNGTFIVYYDYLEGGPDVEEAERVHLYYYAVEYTYRGASNLKVMSVVEDGYESQRIGGWKPVVESLRVKSIKKVADISGITKVEK